MEPTPLIASHLDPEASLLRETNRRQAVLSLVFAFGYAFYGFTSYQMIKQYMPNLELWDNVWPRIVFNSLPYFLLAWMSHRRVLNDARMAIIGMIAIPFFFMAACMVHVWPLIAAGHSSIYGFVHGANIFMISMSFLVLSPPPRYLNLLVAAFSLFFFLPIVGILYWSGNIALLQMFLGDVAIVIPILYLLAVRIHRVQSRLAYAEQDLKQRIKPFLGEYVASALYENRADLLRDRKSQGLILSLDIRGFSKLMRDLSPVELHEFLRQYYSVIGRVVHNHGGHVHKSMGDGHLVSFGVMELPDLSDIPDLAEAVAFAEQRRKHDLHQHALQAFFAIEKDFIELLERYPQLSKDGLGLGGGLAYGDVHLAIYGDEDHKQEFEISGATVVLSSRLEQYTKVLRSENKNWQSGVFSVVVTCDQPPALHHEAAERSWRHLKALKIPVPDFQDVRALWFSSNVSEAHQVPTLSRVV